MENENILIYPSQFDSQVNVMVIFPGHEKYDEMKPLFDEYGFGFIAPEESLVIINGDILGDDDDFDIDILRFIEAHELGHFMLEHNTRNPEDEKDADLYAYILLGGKGYDKAQEYLVDSFEERHGEPFNKTMIEKFK
jgi:Zn-dependent peptidase ImmA (M78 family)